MKILMVIPYFIPAWNYGGPIQVCFLLSKTLAKMGHDVTVATTDILNPQTRIKIQLETIDNVKIIRFKNLNNRFSQTTSLYPPLGFKKWLLQNIPKYDIIHCHDFFTCQNILINKICKKFNKPYFIQPHGSAVPKNERGRVFIKKIFNFFWGKKILKEATNVIAVTPEEKKEIQQYFSIKNITILPNSVENFKYQKIKNIKKKYNLPQGSKIITSIGRIHKIKGFDLLIKTFYYLHKKNKNLYLIIIGPDAGELENLKKIISQKKIEKFVIFPGIVSGNEKYHYLKNSDIFALFSKNEAFPMVVLEAIQAHLPIVISKNTGISNIINKYKIGKLINPLKTKQNALIIEKLLNSKPPTSKNFDRIIKKYDIINITKKLLHLYDRQK